MFVRPFKQRSYALPYRFGRKYILFRNIFLDENMGNLVKMEKVESVSFYGFVAF